jgi:hypothetical protein
VTNNNGFWIGWLDLLTLFQSLLITINHSVIANLPASQITRTRSILIHVLRCTPSILILWLWFFHNSLTTSELQLQFSNLPSYRFSLYSLWSDAMENTVSCVASRVYLTLYSNGSSADHKKTPLQYCWPCVCCGRCLALGLFVKLHQDARAHD